jgi:enterochelin esterase family protein
VTILSVETLLERAEREGTPVIDGETATFVWRGLQAPRLIGDFNHWGRGDASPIALTQVAPEVWIQSVTLPRDAYIEYIYVQDAQHVRDPFNRHACHNGMGGWNQSFRMPASVPTPLVRVRRGVPRGRLTRHSVPGDGLVVGGHRDVYLYQPPTSEPAPLLVVLDGQDYLRRARLIAIVDNLIAQGRIRPLALALVEHGGQARIVEYNCSESTIFFLLNKVLPLAREQLHLLDINTFPGAYGLLGASLAGLMALYTGLRVPQVFGRVLSQSGSFGVIAPTGYEMLIFDLVQYNDIKPINVWMDVGQFESLLPSNRRMRDLLQARGHAVTYREYAGEHNYTCWRDDIWRGLETLFGPESAGA